jgi:hypothetical protein
LVVDSQGVRPMSDRLLLSGIGTATTRTVATLRRMLVGMATTPAVPHRASELAEAMRVHAAALSFSEDCFKTSVRGLTNATVRAVVARAYYTDKLDEVKQFAVVLTTGIMKFTSDASAILLRNNLLAEPRTGRGGMTLLEMYGKTERALMACLRKETLNKLYEARSELFPLPEEQQAPKGKRGKKEGA